ncbi:hypothetical protein C8R43DRAFT_1141023 [Mycena crocata]|nr:hypothetical protein C8R43DRAFT_1141023 [Mycena crocata]
MSSDPPSSFTLEYLGTSQHKRREHAEAQRRYRENPGTDVQVCLALFLPSLALISREWARMVRLRAKNTTPAQIQEAAAKRRKVDAEYREL